jgi:poly-beta-1,6-N-acetyl-D-glucosamine synthase
MIMIPEIPEMLGWILVGVFGFAFLVQLFYYLKIFRKLAFYKEEKPAIAQMPVSVVICAKNEAKNLHKNIPLYFSQDYPEFQVVVVNDCSGDESEEILEEFEKKYPNLHVVTLKEDEINDHDKKLALTLGIKGAKYEHMLLTDADCVPVDKNWIASMVRNFTPGTEIVLGYGGYKKAKGFLNKLIRFDTFFIALQYLSYALDRNTYMGIGRNMAYTKTLYFRNKGFASHYHIQSGDDDLFINRVSTPNNVRVEVSPESITLSEPKKSYRNWFNQKRRHITTARYYKTIHQFMLALFTGTNYLFFLLALVLLVFRFQPYVILSAILFRYLIQIIIFKKTMDKLGEKDLLFLSPILELVLLFYYPSFSMGNMFGKKQKWK